MKKRKIIDKKEENDDEEFQSTRSYYQRTNPDAYRSKCFHCLFKTQLVLIILLRKNLQKNKKEKEKSEERISRFQCTTWLNFGQNIGWNSHCQ